MIAGIVNNRAGAPGGLGDGSGRGTRKLKLQNRQPHTKLCTVIRGARNSAYQICANLPKLRAAQLWHWPCGPSSQLTIPE
jgi:hypothetical protein